MQSVVYNVPPIRAKERPYLDVISESLNNNALRLAIGWAIVDPTTLPPASVILSFWFGGAFLMAAKRLSEYRDIVASHGKELLVRYRTSFAGYSESSLIVCCFVYALLSCFFLAVFLIKYRTEYLLLMPGVIVLFAKYLVIAMQPRSCAQRPEKLFQERGLMLVVVGIAAVFLFATFVGIAAIEAYSQQMYIHAP